MIAFLIVIILIFMVALIIGLFYVLKFARIILKVEETLEIALQELDVSYNVVSDILEKPIFFDSIEVRQVIDEITRARNLLLNIATVLTESVLLIDDDKESDLDEKNSIP